MRRLEARKLAMDELDDVRQLGETRVNGDWGSWRQGRQVVFLFVLHGLMYPYLTRPFSLYSVCHRTGPLLSSWTWKATRLPP